MGLQWDKGKISTQNKLTCTEQIHMSLHPWHNAFTIQTNLFMQINKLRHGICITIFMIKCKKTCYKLFNKDFDYIVYTLSTKSSWQDYFKKFRAFKLLPLKENERKYSSLGNLQSMRQFDAIVFYQQDLIYFWDSLGFFLVLISILAKATTS